MGNPWMDHVKAVKKANPDKSLKEVLKMAGKTYKKQAKAPGAKKAKKTRKVRKSKKGSRKGSRKGTKKARRSRRHRGGKPVDAAPAPGSENFASV
tara:strand:- start:955 stop:1239 length:285 start_codon:yes stop_codon:yes gene_type:complete